MDPKSEWNLFLILAMRIGVRAAIGYRLRGKGLWQSPEYRISLLKVDIEGAEAVVFGRDCQSWLGKVDAIAIELHDDSGFGNASGIFFDAIRGHGFEVSSVGELTICQRPDQPAAAQ